MNYPAALDTSSSLPNPTGTSTQNNPDHANLHSSENAAIIAVEGKVGIGATTPAANQLLFGTGAGTSAWQALTSAQLAAVLSDETGSGAAVFANTPVLITPKVDMINENTGGNGVTVGGVNLKSGVVTGSGAGLTANTVPGTANTNNSITAQQINWTGIGANAGIWWEELGRTTLGVAGNVISIASMSARKYLRVIIAVQGTGGTISVGLRWNSDSAANYSYRQSDNGAADATSLSQTNALITGASTYANLMYVGDVINIAGQEKLMQGTRFDPVTAGAATAPSKSEQVHKWANTAAQITSVSTTNVGTGNYAAGSELTVLGHN